MPRVHWTPQAELPRMMQLRRVLVQGLAQAQAPDLTTKDALRGHREQALQLRPPLPTATPGKPPL